MKNTLRNRTVGRLLAISMILANTALAAPTYKILYNFKGGNAADGGNPYAALIMDNAGNLYGTTVNGGSRNSGTVFELSPQAGGTWSETIVYNFLDFSGDGTEPYASLTFDAAGNLYGTTWGGGVGGYGVVFELSPQGGGVWNETILHSFPTGTTDGQTPYCGVVFDSAGNLYGATWSGGINGAGVVFELTPRTGGTWSEKILRRFSNTGPDGYNAYTGNLLVDTAGNVYGATYDGAQNHSGAIFEFSPKAGGGWTEKVLLASTGSPFNGLTMDAAGNLYGTTYNGNRNGGGTVFELTPQTTGNWKPTILHAFNPSTKDGREPYAAGLVMDAAGNLYGTTYYGGAFNFGTVYELTPQSTGGWKETILHSFNNNGVDGYQPAAGLVMDSAGNLYGTTWSGGSSGQGVVFEITP
jgi:uncharacterized repeat protein (TIGR03803 family)